MLTNIPLQFVGALALLTSVTLGIQAAEKEPAGRKRALLVGSAKYDTRGIQRLTGPTNDVQLMRTTLLARGFAREDIVLLADDVADAAGRPTRKNISDRFTDLGKTANPGDHIVILLSGHGDQQPNVPDPKRPDPDDEDGLDEVYLPVDCGERDPASDKPFPNPIVDDELFAWCQQITGRGARVWIIFDCCHSGEGIRGDLGEVAREASSGVQKRGSSVRVKLKDIKRGPAAAGWDADEPVKNLIVFYACRSQEQTYERPMPYAAENAIPAVHGLFTYTICKVLRESAGAERSYRDLSAAVWAQYRTWGRLGPTPYIDGPDANLAILGASKPSRQHPLTPTGKARWSIPAGDLDGLSRATVLAVHSPTDPKTPLGHVVITKLGPAESQVEAATAVKIPGVPEEYKKPELLGILPDGCYGVVKYLDYGDMRVKLAVDLMQPKIGAAERRQLERLHSELVPLAARPGVVFQLCPAAEAGWLVQIQNGKPVLVNRSAAVSAARSDRAGVAPPVLIPDDATAAGLTKQLERVFRVDNLLRICRPVERSAPVAFHDSVNVKVSMVRYRDKAGSDPKVLQWENGPPTLHPGEFVGWEVENLSANPVDITLLYVDADLNVQPVFPSAQAIGANNRLDAGRKSFRTSPIEVTDSPLGTEQLVVIALPGIGPLKDFRILAEADLDKAKAVEKGIRGPKDNVINTPLGQLLSHAVFHEKLEDGNGLRGMKVNADAGSASALFRLTWNTVKE